MAELLHLPNELLLGIINVIHIEDIEAFTLCNKRIYSLSQDVLQKHRAMKKKYSTVRCTTLDSDTLDIGLNVHPGVWLCEIVLNETVASYPTTLCMQDSPSPFRRKPKHAQSESLMRNIEDQIHSKLEKCPYIQGMDMKSWKLSLSSGYFDTALSLLLTLLPNLRSIFIGHLMSKMVRTQQMLAKIANFSQAENVDSHALSRLVSMRYIYDARMKRDLDFSLLFTGLPSIRSICGHNVNSLKSNSTKYPYLLTQPDTSGDFKTLVKTSGSKVTDIRFTQSKISTLCFQDYLCQINALQNFEYGYDGDGPADFEPRKIVNSLLAYASHSLVRLDLSIEPYWNRHSSHNSNVDNAALRGSFFIGSLRGFQILKTVKVNKTMFIEKNLNIGMGCEEYSKVHRLVDLLPASIERLHLIEDPGYQPHVSIFDDLLESKVQKFTKLEKIKLECFHPLAWNLKHLKQACHEVGVQLVSSHEPTSFVMFSQI